MKIEMKSQEVMDALQHWADHVFKGERTVLGVEWMDNGMKKTLTVEVSMLPATDEEDAK